MEKITIKGILPKRIPVGQLQNQPIWIEVGKIINVGYVDKKNAIEYEAEITNPIILEKLKNGAIQNCSIIDEKLVLEELKAKKVITRIRVTKELDLACANKKE